MLSHVQTLILSKDHFTLRSANNWIKDHKFRPIKPPHETINTFRFRIRHPSDKYDYRIKKITEGVKAVIGYENNLNNNIWKKRKFINLD